jgi:hypothetical protein
MTGATRDVPRRAGRQSGRHHTKGLGDPEASAIDSAAVATS